jgi:hypothetical protein
MTRPRSSARSRFGPSLLLLAATLGAGGCAAPLAIPPVAVTSRARDVPSYSARLNVSLRGKDLRARTPVLLAFRRPDALRIEIPGPGGARVIAVAEGDRLWAVFPSERALYSGSAQPADMESLLGVALAPREIMDLLTGVANPRLLSYRPRWGASFPRQIEATLPDGARLEATVEDVEAPATALGPTAFTEPPHAGYRTVGADEARSLWSGR